MSYAKSFLCVALTSALLSGCAWFGSKEADEKLEAEIASLMLDQQILETRLSLTEDRVISLQSDFNEINEKLFADAAQADKIKTNASKKSVAQTNKELITKPADTDARSFYKNALTIFNAADYKQSEKLFKEFLKIYPKSSLAPNAGYWLGESYYSQGRYDEAILSFQSVLQKYPKHHKAPDALLKIGYSYRSLNDKINARFYLEQLLKKYPHSEPAPLASAMLARLG